MAPTKTAPKATPRDSTRILSSRSISRPFGTFWSVLSISANSRVDCHAGIGLGRAPLAVVAVAATVVRQPLAAEVSQQCLPATAAALRITDNLLMLAHVAVLAVA